MKEDMQCTTYNATL